MNQPPIHLDLGPGQIHSLKAYIQVSKALGCKVRAEISDGVMTLYKVHPHGEPLTTRPMAHFHLGPASSPELLPPATPFVDFGGYLGTRSVN